MASEIYCGKLFTNRSQRVRRAIPRQTCSCAAKFNTQYHHDSPFLILNIIQTMFERTGFGIVL